MKSLSIIAVFFLVTLAKSVPTKSNGDVVAANLKITQIERKAKETSSDSEKFTFIFTNDELIISDVKKFMLDEYDEPKPEIPVSTEDFTETTATFDIKLTDFSGEDVNFLIKALDVNDASLAFGDVDLKPFPIFPDILSSTTISNDVVLPGGPLLRVEGKMGTMTIDDGTFVENGNIYYWSFPTLISLYIPCKTTSGIPVCDEELKPNKVAATKGEIMSSVVLSYMPGNQATIKFKASDSAPDILDVILMTSTTTMSSPENVLCTKQQTVDDTCIIQWTGLGTDLLKMILFQAKAPIEVEDNWATNSIEIYDRELVITTLGNDIIEGRWNIIPGELAIYTLTSTESAGNDNTVDVDCSHLISTDKCFGYFPNLGSGTYTLTVALQSDGQLRQIESLPEKLGDPLPELRILSRHTIEHQHLQKANVKTCFWLPAPTGERLFSHYEMLIINGKGQWLKHTTMEEVEEERESEGNLCFTSFTLNTRDFDLTEGTKVVVSQRGADGFTVLATGESTLF